MHFKTPYVDINQKLKCAFQKQEIDNLVDRFIVFSIFYQAILLFVNNCKKQKLY
jgi:hypothetical protein